MAICVCVVATSSQTCITELQEDQKQWEHNCYLTLVVDLSLTDVLVCVCVCVCLYSDDWFACICLSLSVCVHVCVCVFQMCTWTAGQSARVMKHTSATVFRRRIPVKLLVTTRASTGQSVCSALALTKLCLCYWPVSHDALCTSNFAALERPSFCQWPYYSAKKL